MVSSVHKGGVTQRFLYVNIYFTNRLYIYHALDCFDPTVWFSDLNLKSKNYGNQIRHNDHQHIHNNHITTLPGYDTCMILLSL